MFQDPIQQAKNRRVAEGAPASVKWAKKHGIKILWGSDIMKDGKIFKNTL